MSTSVISSFRAKFWHPKEIKFKKTLGKVPLPVSIAAASERLRSPYTSILCHPLFCEICLRSYALSVRYS